MTAPAPDSARRLVEHAQEHWLCALWMIYLATGVRRGEALGLAWSDINLKTGEMRVRRTVQRVKGEIVFGEPKTARSRGPCICPTSASKRSGSTARWSKTVPFQRNATHTRSSRRTLCSSPAPIGLSTRAVSTGPSDRY